MSTQAAPTAPKPCKRNRQLTVSYASTDTPGVDVPYLRLRGRWLQNAGFVIGRQVSIEVDEGKLIIETCGPGA
jgi:toxic protein SymE